MADLRVEGRRRARWPWLIGAAVLALLIWAISELVDTGRDDDTLAQAQAAGVSGSESASVPGAEAPSTAGASGAQESVGVTPLGALVPLGIQHVGQRVRASGQVLTKPAAGGFWLRSEGNAVIWVRSSQSVKPGQQVQDLGGVLAASRPGQLDQRLQGTDLQKQATSDSGTQLATEVYLDTSPGGGARDTAAARVARRTGAAGAARAGAGG